MNKLDQNPNPHRTHFLVQEYRQKKLNISKTVFWLMMMTIKSDTGKSTKGYEERFTILDGISGESLDNNIKFK